MNIIANICCTYFALFIHNENIGFICYFVVENVQYSFDSTPDNAWSKISAHGSLLLYSIALMF